MGQAPHIHEGRLSEVVGERRQLVDVDPSDGFVFLGCHVRGCSLPTTDEPSADLRRVFGWSSYHPARVRCRCRRNLYAELLV